MTTQVKSINEILAKSYPQFGKFKQQDAEIKQLNKLFREILASNLSSHCQIAKFSRGTLTLIVDNSSWATRLRFAKIDIIKILAVQPEFSKLEKIRWRVRTDFFEEKAIKKSPKTSFEKQQASKLKSLAAKLAKK